MYIANIGLERADGSGRNSWAETLDAVWKHIPCTVNYAHYMSNHEPVLVIAAYHASETLVASISALCTELGQDCVAVLGVDDGKGALIGPGATRWGEFDPQLFVLLDGTRAQAQLPLAA